MVVSYTNNYGYTDAYARQPVNNMTDITNNMIVLIPDFILKIIYYYLLPYNCINL